MILDRIQKLQYDWVIAGSGPAGLTLATDLSRLKPTARILILEAGGLQVTPVNQATFEGQLRIQGPNGLLHSDNDYASYSRLKVLGGTSAHWTGWIRPFTAADFDENSWGLPLADLIPHYDSTFELLKCPRRHSTFIGEPFGSGQLITENKFWVQAQPTRFGEIHRNFLSQSSQVDICLGSTLQEIHVADQRRVSRVSFVRHGETTTVSCGGLVLAMGAIENSRALLNVRRTVGTSVDEQGWNSPLLASCFMEHLHLDVGDIYLREDYDWNRFNTYEPQIEPSVLVFNPSSKTKTSVQFDLDPTIARTNEFWGDTQAIDFMSDYYNMKYGATMVRKRLRAILEHPSDPRNKCSYDTHGRCSINIDFTSALLEEVHTAIDSLAAELLNARLGFVRRRDLDFRKENWKSYFAFYGHHHIGTTKIGKNTSSGVVDPNLLVHGTENLYVAGASVFPQGGYIPPTATIIALSKRLAHSLAKA